jgi:hypothetical protein
MRKMRKRKRFLQAFSPIPLILLIPSPPPDSPQFMLCWACQNLLHSKKSIWQSKCSDFSAKASGKICKVSKSFKQWDRLA